MTPNIEELKIIEFEERYLEDLKALSYEWLCKYDLLEPADELIINNPRELIIDKGGHVYFARHGDEIIGTASIIRVDEDTFELAKFAVKENYQGLKVGRKLLEKCLDTAKNENAVKVILYSNHKLEKALALYRKYGFRNIEYDAGKYLEADLKMELYMNAGL